MPGNNNRAFVVERQQERMEITLYGEIVERRPEDWTGKAEEGDYIVQSEFLDALSGVSGVRSLHLRINSIGGDAGVACSADSQSTARACRQRREAVLYRGRRSDERRQSDYVRLRQHFRKSREPDYDSSGQRVFVRRL